MAIRISHKNTFEYQIRTNPLRASTDWYPAVIITYLGEDLRKLIWFNAWARRIIAGENCFSEKFLYSDAGIKPLASSKEFLWLQTLCLEYGYLEQKEGNGPLYV